MNLPIAINQLPPLLQPELSQFWQDYQQHRSDSNLTENATLFNSLLKVWACSPFVARYCLRYPQAFQTLIDSETLLTPTCDYADSEQLLNNEDDEETALGKLRQYRHQAMVKIAWRDLAGWAELQETLTALSNLADALIQTALDYAYHRLSQQWGIPSDKTGQPQQMVVLSMGKLGGQELNFSSDIDLIFLYPEDGETQGTKRTRSNQEFFQRLGQQLIHLLNTVTGDGFVYRVDMRLRPFGESGPLVMHFAAMEDYCETHARDWERYAFVKARVCAGDKQQGQQLLDNLRPFVYRRYLDYNSLEELRKMKELIDAETQRKGLENNIKLGRGGIREVEFICQVFQLIRGGRKPILQQRNLLKTLQLLANQQYLSSTEVEQLREAYYFLRLTENHLQAIEDKQTQTLPTDELNQTRLAYSLNFPDWQSFLTALQRHQHIVQQQFAQVIAPTYQPTVAKPQNYSWQTLWHNYLTDATPFIEALEEAGFKENEKLIKHLKDLSSSYVLQKLGNRSRERVDTLIPLIISLSAHQTHPDVALHRSLDLIEAIAQRGVYLALLIERPKVLERLIELFTHSSWIATQITRYPLLLDELLDPRRLYDPLKPEELDKALQTQFSSLASDDLEMQMDSLRQFKRAHVLHIAAAELSGDLTVEVASDYLAAVADSLVRQALQIAWYFLTKKHGFPHCQDDPNSQKLRPAGFCIVGYGKAGGIELSYGSDLDIVFLHDSRGDRQMTDGDKALDNNVFFIRLAQRIIHILTTKTPGGILYEVDPRLRPGGASGLLVSSLDAFTNYQREEAWTWEHQALVRARAIAGDRVCMNQFEIVRRSILSQSRDSEDLKQAVIDMREKMRANLDKSTDSLFDIKQGNGGITDIEFIVQYGVLRWATKFSDLLDTTGMLPILNKFLQYQLFPRQACQQLSAAYRDYRAETHRLALQEQPSQVPLSQFATHRQQVIHWWQQLLQKQTDKT